MDTTSDQKTWVVKVRTWREKRETDPASSSGNKTVEKFEELLKRAEALIEQTQHLYQSYLKGMDDQHPRLKRQQLEELMGQLANLPKPSPVSRFRYSTLVARFTQNRERWDRLMKDLETGRIQRPRRAA